jgi:hypothetical protein
MPGNPHLREQDIGIKTLKTRSRSTPRTTPRWPSSPSRYWPSCLLIWNVSSCVSGPRAPARLPPPRGKHPERPHKLDTNKLAAARAAIDVGQLVDQVAAAFGVSCATIYRYLAEHNHE